MEMDIENKKKKEKAERRGKLRINDLKKFKRDGKL